MKDKEKFVKKASVFLVIMIVTLFLLNFAYLEIVENNKQNYRTEEMYEEFIQENELRYVFFGDSHASDAIHPDFIDDSFNLAMGGEDYTDTFYKVQKTVNEVDVETIVLGLDLHTFSSNVRTDERLFKNAPYYSEFVDLKTIAKLKGQNIGVTTINAYIPVIGNGREFASYLINRQRTEIVKGWTNNTRDYFKKTEEEKESIVSKRTKLHYDGAELIEERSFEHFLKIIELAKNEEINIVFIKYPLTTQYLDKYEAKGLNSEQYYSKIFEEINKITEEYYVLDYQNTYSNQTELFGNSDHLNNKGAVIFSKKVNIDLQDLFD